MRLLLGGAILSLGLSSVVFPASTFAQAQQSSASEAQVNRMVEALRLAAPKTGTANDGYYSEWQVKPETLKGWSKTCLKKEVTPTEFENNSGLARQVVSCIARRELNNQLTATGSNETAAVRGVACWWMTGNYTGCNSGFTGDYVKKVAGYYQQQRKPASSTTKPATSPSS